MTTEHVTEPLFRIYLERRDIKMALRTLLGIYWSEFRKLLKHNLDNLSASLSTTRRLSEVVQEAIPVCLKDSTFIFQCRQLYDLMVNSKEVAFRKIFLNFFISRFTIARQTKNDCKGFLEKVFGLNYHIYIDLEQAEWSTIDNENFIQRKRE